MISNCELGSISASKDHPSEAVLWPIESVTSEFTIDPLSADR